jgi:parvulin-like peptidyl-prolyl isomerase
MIYLLLTLLLLPAVAHADEKIVAVPRDQFVKVLAEVQQNKQLLTESGKLLAEYKDMFEKQKAYVETLEGLNENRKQESDLLQEQNAALNEQLDAERQRKEDLAWHEKAQWAGYGVAVPTAIIILRKLILKF